MWEAWDRNPQPQCRSIAVIRHCTPDKKRTEKHSLFLCRLFHFYIAISFSMECAVLETPPLAYAAASDKNLCALTATARHYCIALQINRDMKAGHHSGFTHWVMCGNAVTVAKENYWKLHCSCSGWPTGNGKKLSNCQACCLAQLWLAPA